MVNGLSQGLGPRTEAGEFVASAGSVVNVSFSKVYDSAPSIVGTVVGGWASVPTASAGSFVANTVTASASGTYIAYWE